MTDSFKSITAFVYWIQSLCGGSTDLSQFEVKTKADILEKLENMF